MLLLGIGALRLGEGAPAPAVAAGAAVAALAAGGIAIIAVRPSTLAACVSAVGAAILVLAAGLGGGVGTRAVLLLGPPFLLASAMCDALLWEDRASGAPPRYARWLPPVLLALAIASVLGLPPGGGFPGAWIALQLAIVRGTASWAAPMTGVALVAALAFAAYAGATLVRRARGPRGVLAAGSVAALLLVYLGVAPVRLALGWLVRAERALALPEVLSSAAPPELVSIGEPTLVTALGVGLLVAGAIVGLGRGTRPAVERPDEAPAPLAAPWRRLAERGGALRERTEEALVGPVLAALLLLGAVAIAVRLVLVAAAQGFL